MAERTLGLIPARGGSKSIPMKNVKPLGGEPLIAYPISTMAKSGVVDRICVSTDSEEIAEVARSWGAEVPFLRPRELAEDSTPTVPVLVHALDWLSQNECYTPDFVLVIQPTEPFVRPHQVRETLDLMLKRGADSAITMVEVPQRNHPFHVRVLTEDGFLEFEHPEAHHAHWRRQMDPPRYAFGNLFWFRREPFLAERRVEVGRRVGLPIEQISAFDLNTAEDWQLAEAALAYGAVPDDATPAHPSR
jgi:CMP-N,N'-diacetyllegionaminic acid synthase